VPRATQTVRRPLLLQLKRWFLAAHQEYQSRPYLLTALSSQATSASILASGFAMEEEPVATISRLAHVKSRLPARVSGAGSAKVNARPKAAKGMPAGIIFIIHPSEMLSNGAATPNFSLRLGFSLTETCRMWGVVMKLVFELAHGLAGLHSALKQTPTQKKSGPEGPRVKSHITWLSLKSACTWLRRSKLNLDQAVKLRASDSALHDCPADNQNRRSDQAHCGSKVSIAPKGICSFISSHIFA
jgi:hypothetical protein